MTSPAVPPNSSMTMAILARWVRISGIRSSTSLVVGRNSIGLRIPEISVTPSRYALQRSRATSSPSILSIDSEYTGRRRCPSSSMIAMACSTFDFKGIATMSVRGVITSPTVTSPSRITLVTTCHSSSSMVPSLYPISASTSISARLTVEPPLRRKSWLKKLRGIKMGFIMNTIHHTRWAAGLPNCCQNVAPIVFGMISENTSMMSVSPAVHQPIRASPNTMPACNPPRAAPAVWAMVLSVRIAAIGSSIFCFITCRWWPAFDPWSFNTST